MTEMFRLLKELTVNRTPKKVLIKEEAGHPINKNVNSISLVKIGEEKSTKDEAILDDISGKPEKSKQLLLDDLEVTAARVCVTAAKKKPIHKKTTFKNSNFNQRVNTVKDKNVNAARPKAVVNAARPKAVVNAVKGNNVNAVKASTCWVWKPKTKVLDHVSKHNSASITLKKFDYGNLQVDLQDQGVIDSGCSRHITGNMSYLTNYEEIDGGYVAFRGNPKGGKITGKRVPRKNNMYSVNLKDIVPKGGLTCLFAKATSDESKLWHRRLGHLNFKTMNKLVKGNLVRGLPSKLFENDETYIACQNGKQHIASYHKVKVIRCDNGTEFKNREMNQFYEMKGILRQYSVARTPQQNGVDERINMTLIEAAKTMLADSKLPTTFWAEAVNTACYVHNRVKAFRVFNSKTRIVEENLHIRFSENTPNVVGSGPDWLFDIDALTRTMNYEPIVADYILLPLWTADPPFSQNPKSSDDDEFKPSSDVEKKVNEDPRKESECNDQEKEDNVNSTNNVNIVSLTVNAAGTNKDNAELPVDPNMLALEDYSIFDLSSDDQEDGAEADMNNLDTTIQVSPIPTTKIHKYNPLNQVIGDLQSAIQIRNMSKNLEEYGFVKEPKMVIHALKDPSWIEAMHEELLQFKLQEVWTLVDLPNGKRAIGTKWVFRNKKDKKGIVIRNKARLVAQRYTQEEGIGYDEVFAPIARIEAIRLFLAYASFNDFMAYQMDVKSAFLYGKIEEEVYVCQPPGFEDPEFPDRVYKVEKALYRLHQAPRAWNETLSIYLLDNGFQRGKIDKTLFIKRYKGDILLVQVYVDDIIFGSTKKELCIAFEKLMHEKFQMSSMGELTFFLGLQVQQKKDGIFISQDKYVGEILKKFGFIEVKTASTPMET
ncbi:putative ribonuclease H-like domain-containing protein [Tanacetum coccineum]